MEQDDELVSVGREKRLVMVVLCGLIGSGKSSFAKALQDYHPDYVRCNQDLLGSRNAVKSLASRSLHASCHVIIDRTNVDESQRATWVDLAKSFSNVELQAIVFETPLEVCEARLAIRTDHETLRDPSHALNVLQSFYRDFVAPIHSEGFQRIISVHPSDFDSATPTIEEVDRILARLKEAPFVNVPLVRSARVTDEIAQREARARGRGGRQWQSRGGANSRGSYFGGNQRGGGGVPGPLQEGPKAEGGGRGDYWQQRLPTLQQNVHQQAPLPPTSPHQQLYNQTPPM